MITPFMIYSFVSSIKKITTDRFKMEAKINKKKGGEDIIELADQIKKLTGKQKW